MSAATGGNVYVLETMADGEAELLGVFRTREAAEQATATLPRYDNVTDVWMESNDGVWNYGGAWGWYITEYPLNTLIGGAE